MIRYDGYYVLDPVPINDSIANYTFSGYNHKAYLFLENGTYLKASSQSKNIAESFLKEDFNCNYPNRFKVKNGDLIITYHTDEEWEFSELFKKKSEGHFEREGKSLRFVKWESHPA